jgi:hypothetical protein
MDSSNTEYRIEIYNGRADKWEECISGLLSKDEAVATLEEKRHYYFNTTYRLVELTVATKVLDI